MNLNGLSTKVSSQKCEISNPTTPSSILEKNDELMELLNKKDNYYGCTTLSIQNNNASSIFPFHAFGCDGVS